jgi:hypothetical protein
MRAEQITPPPPFENYFQAETYLEKQGYQCKNGLWVKPDAPDATAVPLENGVQIKFNQTVH